MVLSSPRASQQQSLSCSSVPLGQTVLKHPNFDHHRPIRSRLVPASRQGLVKRWSLQLSTRWATIRWKGHSCQSGWPKKRLADHSTAPTSWAWCSRCLGSQGHFREPQLYCGLGRIGSPQRRIRRRNASHRTARLDQPLNVRLNLVVVDRTDSAGPKVGQWYRHV
jgi:hypothetical protein